MYYTHLHGVQLYSTSTLRRFHFKFFQIQKNKRTVITMGQKRLDSFFTTRSVPVTEQKKPRTGVAAAAEQGGQEQTNTANNNTSSIQARMVSNKNHAFAKQAVIACEHQGIVPRLKDLLIEPTWKSALETEFEKSYFETLEEFVRAQWNGGKLVFPPKDCIFRAYNAVPLDKVRVVILGQDPYHDLGQAQGLSFSVPTGKQLPSSLRNIFKEISEDIGCTMPKNNGCLEPWSHQGVLMLNAVLTVEAHKAASHSKKGWEEFTTHTVRVINKELSGVVFLLWGKYAQEKGSLIDRKRHHVLTCAHPSGLSAHRGFFGCKHFSKTNELLERQGLAAIQWQI